MTANATWASPFPDVLDVASGAPLVDAGTRNVAPDVTLLKERVTGVVNLSRIPALPVPVEVGG